MTVSEAIRRRRSIRRYQAGIVIPREEICQMLEAAMMAPSACNTRPWEFVVVEDKARRETLAKVHPYCSFAPDASIVIVVCGLPERQEATGGWEFWPQDCGAAIENLLLEAYALGYGTCWCGVYPNPERVKALQELLGVTSTPLAAVAVGAPAEAPAARGFFDERKVRFL